MSAKMTSPHADSALEVGIALSKPDPRERVRRFLTYYGSLTGLVILILVFGIAAPNFFTTRNIITLLQQASVTGLMALGFTFVLILGGLDLSVGGVPGFAGSLVGVLLAAGHGNVFAIACGMAAGALLGMTTGLLVTKLRIGIFLAGLGMSWICRGADLWVTNYDVIHIRDNPAFLRLGQGQIGPIPISFLITGCVFIVMHIVMTRTRFGRDMYAIGGSEEGAAAAGINVTRYKLVGFILSGLLGAMGGILLVSRAGAAVPRSAEAVWIDALLSGVFGATVLTGGVPNVLGTGMGVLFTAVLINGFSQLNVNEFYQMVIKGVALISIVGLGSIGGKMLDVVK